MKNPIRIGTRNSELAIWQAQTVQALLEAQGYSTVLVPVKTIGDTYTVKPLYEIGVVGVFTRALDTALLKKEIDLAVHSMKDMPTQLPEGLAQAAVLERGVSDDVLVHQGTGFLQGEGTIATGSLRRRAQWLYRYPKHKIVDLRGNLNTRLIKLINSDWQGAIFAKAGLERIRLLPKDAVVLDWMVPAPAQGAVAVVTLEENKFVKDACLALNHEQTQLAVEQEREFLRALQGGCTAPIGAKVNIDGDVVRLTGCLHALDGSAQITVEKERPLRRVSNFGKSCAYEMLENGGKELMDKIKIGLKDIVNKKVGEDPKA